MKNEHRAMLFVGALFGREEIYLRARERLVSFFGPYLTETPPVRWEYSRYYSEDLGWPITRRFLFFGEPISQDEIAAIKCCTRGIEAELSVDGRRGVNLDPGYLTTAKVVLASTKDYSHRIYLGDGIYGELALIFRDDRFHPHLNTYRDYRDEACLKIFAEARAMLKRGSTGSGGENTGEQV